MRTHLKRAGIGGLDFNLSSRSRPRDYIASCIHIRPDRRAPSVGTSVLLARLSPRNDRQIVWKVAEDARRAEGAQSRENERRFFGDANRPRETGGLRPRLIKDPPFSHTGRNIYRTI